MQHGIDPVAQGAHIDAQRAVDDVQGAFDIGIGVCVTDDERGCQHPAANQFLQEQRTQRLTRPSVRIAGEVQQIAVAADHADVFAEPQSPHPLLDSEPQSSTLGVQVFDYPATLVGLHGRDGGGQRW